MRQLLVGLFFCAGLAFAAGTGCTSSDSSANDPKVQDKGPKLEKLTPGGAGVPAKDGKKSSGPANAKPE